MSIWLAYGLAALAEIAGCFAIWLWLREARSPFWLLPGIALLVTFAILLTRIPSGSAGRAFAAYGGVYIVASLGWMWAIEGERPVVTDLAGAALILLGVGVIVVGVAR